MTNLFKEHRRPVDKSSRTLYTVMQLIPPVDNRLTRTFSNLLCDWLVCLIGLRGLYAIRLAHSVFRHEVVT